MRVLFLATRDYYHPGSAGGDNVMWEFARYLSFAGHDVTYVAAAYGRAPRNETLDGIHVKRRGSLHMLWLTSFLHYIRNARGRVDIVIVEGFGGSRVPRFAPLYVREPIITEWHQAYSPLFAAQYPRLMHGPLNLLERITARVSRNTLVRAYTEEVKQDFVRLGFRQEQIFVLPVSIPDDWLSRPVAEPIKAPNLIWIGKIRRYKRPDHAVLALRKVVDCIPNARLTIVGRHDDRAYERFLVDLVRKLGLQDRVEFQFNVTDDEKRALLSTARALVLPSAVEGFGIVVLEANSSGVPVIASTGVPEGAVSHGRNGLRYQSGDVDSLAMSICEVLLDDEAHAKLSAGAREFATAYGWTGICGRYAEVVEDLASRRQPLSQPRPATMVEDPVSRATEGWAQPLAVAGEDLAK